MDTQTTVECAPVSVPARRSMLYLVGALAGGNIVSVMVGVISVALQGRLVMPDVLGLFTKVGLVILYIPLLQLGVGNGLNRELPYFIGKGEHQRVRDLAAAAQAWAIVVSAVVGLAMLLVAGWYFIHGNMQLSFGWVTNAILAFFVFYGQYYLQITFRTGHDFARLAMANVVQNVLALVLLVLVIPFAFYGLCLRIVLACGGATVLLYYWRPVRVGPQWNSRHLKHLLSVGAPIFGVGLLYSWWAACNLTIVSMLTDDYQTGLYKQVINVALPLELLTAAVAQVIYPRMSEQYGRTGKVEGLLRMTVKPVALAALGMIPLIAVALWLVDPAVRLIMPRYVDAVPAMRWALLVPFIGSFAPVNLMFNVVRRQDLYVVAIVTGAITHVGCLLWLIHDLVRELDFNLGCSG